MQRSNPVVVNLPLNLFRLLVQRLRSLSGSARASPLSKWERPPKPVEFQPQPGEKYLARM